MLKDIKHTEEHFGFLLDLLFILKWSLLQTSDLVDFLESYFIMMLFLFWTEAIFQQMELHFCVCVSNYVLFFFSFYSCSLFNKQTELSFLYNFLYNFAWISQNYLSASKVLMIFEVKTWSLDMTYLCLILLISVTLTVFLEADLYCAASRNPCNVCEMSSEQRSYGNSWKL